MAPNCPRVVEPKLGGFVPSTCPFLTQPLVYFDPLGGSDTNTCITTGSPCKSMLEVLRRYGCGGSPNSSPQLPQLTVYDWLKSEPNATTDEFSFTPQLSAGGGVFITGTLAAGPTGSIASVVHAKSRSGNQLLVITTTGAGTPVQGTLAHNTTHPSRAWVDSVSGSNLTMSQPFVVANTPPTPLGTFPAEVDSWTMNDAIFFETPPLVNIRNYAPVYQDGTTGASLAFASDFWVPDPSGTPSVTEVFWANSITAQEVRVDAALDAVLPGDGLDLATGTLGNFDNLWLSGGVALNATQVNGGAANTLAPGFADPIFGARVNFDGDVILHGELSADGGELSVENAWVDSVGGGIAVFSGHVTTSTGSAYSGPTIYGPGAISVLFNAEASYPSGAGAAASAYKLSGGLLLNDQGRGCVGNPAASSTTLTCNVAVTPASLDSTLGATIANGCLYVPGGASVCNFNE